MNYSAELIEKLKKHKSFDKDSMVVEVLPKTSKGTLSEIKNGKRHLTEEQALWIAEQCKLDAKLVLVELAEECAKCEAAKTVWHSLAKKMKAATSVMALASLLLISGVSGQFSPQRRIIP